MYFFQFGFGNDVLKMQIVWCLRNPSGEKTYKYVCFFYVNRWTEENPTSDMPRAKATGSDQYCSLYIEEWVFLKIKIVGYRI